jgi:hypothetical protein
VSARDPDASDPDAPPPGFINRLLAAPGVPGAPRELGTTPLARKLGLPEDQLGGHWCSRCRGIWYGCALEVECPACGNRRG